MDKYRVTLTAEERADLEHLVSSGKGAARRLTHARILLLADAAVSGRHTDEQIVAALGVGICTVGRVRRPPTLAEALQAAEVTGLRQQTFLLLPDTRQGVTLLSRAGLGQLPREEVSSMWRNMILEAGLFVVLVPAGTLAQEWRQRVEVEVYVPEGARLFIEGQEMRSTGPQRLFVSPPLPPGKYTYTLKALIPSCNGPRTVTRRIDVRPGDFESIDLREPGQRPITNVDYEPTPQNVVDALLRLAKVTNKDEVWDLGCGDGRIPVTAAKEYGCKAYGFDIDPKRVKDSLANVRRHGVERLVTIKKRDIFTLDLSKGPTIVTLYLLPHLNARLLPQLRKLPPGARVISVVHRMADIKPDEYIVVRTPRSEFDVYLWKAETLRGK